MIPTLIPTRQAPVAELVKQPTNATEALQPQWGYVEDIQPIFQRNCIACHSSVVRQLNLQVTSYEALMAGSSNGAVVVPGDSAASRLWEMIDTGKMPLIGELRPEEKTIIRQWIDGGALERRNTVGTPPQLAENAVNADPTDAGVDSAATTEDAALWLRVAQEGIDPVADSCADPLDEPAQVVSADLILPISCGIQPRTAQLQSLLQSLAIVPTASRPLPATATLSRTTTAAPDVEVDAPPAAVTAPVASIPQ
ncbi:MAG: hypothetical protein KDE31_32205, partial [Caldilineaceae bacterium]|nr:hypothetical protein [Caldilineaceae bacterium]